MAPPRDKECAADNITKWWPECIAVAAMWSARWRPRRFDTSGAAAEEEPLLQLVQARAASSAGATAL